MAWYDEAVFYHIYPLGMAGAPRKNDYGEPVERLERLLPWIRHIKDIGCNALYIGPLFESEGHGYETTDYMKLDSRLGTNETLKRFVAYCHENGIRVIFDGVFNHTGRSFFAFKDLLAAREGSRYKDWYCNVNFYGNNSYNDGFSYQNWGGYDLLVKLNQKNPEVKDYICNVIRFWVSEFDIDGIRLDAADVLDFDFMKALRHTANEVKQDFWLMGEVIHGDYTRWANADMLHSVTNYNLHKALYSGYNDKNFFEIAHTVKRLNDMNGGIFRLYNFVDNHDVERIMSKLSSPKGFAPVHILLYTLPGIPSIYYGSEFGIEGKKGHGEETDTPLRPELKYEDWTEKMESSPYVKLITVLGKIRLAAKAFSYGDYRELLLTNRQYAYSRSFEGKTAVVMANIDDGPCTIHGSAPDGEYIDVVSGREIQVSGGGFSAEIPGNSGAVWILKSEAEGVEALQPIVPEPEKVPDSVDNSINIADLPEKEIQTGEAADLPENSMQSGAALSDADADGGQAKTAETEAAEPEKEKPAALRTDIPYEEMTIEELQAAILEKMRKNGPVTDQMRGTVIENTHKGSLLNWVRSFR